MIRPATLADVPAIVSVHSADVVTWRRWDAQGEAHLADYRDLAPHERWLNGGPWLDPTTYAPYLARLLEPDAGGVALVAEEDGQVRAVAEAVVGDEPLPYGRHLDIAVIYTLRGHGGRGLGSALMAALHGRALAAGCQRLLVTHAEAPRFYVRHGFEPLETWRRARLRPLPSQTRYAAEPCTPDHYGQVRGWAMPIGRYQSARQEWSRLQPDADPAFAEWQHLRRETWLLHVRQAPAFLALEEEPRALGQADAHLWVPPGVSLSRQLLSAVRDRAARSGYTGLLAFLRQDHLAALPRGWEDEGYRQHVWVKDL